MKKSEYLKLFADPSWTVEKLEIIFDLIEKINDKHFQFDHYPAQFEIVSSEQLLDNYSSIGLPFNYPHWSFGKEYMINKNAYQKGEMGLSYEMIPNVNPNISYNLEDNDTCLMTLVYAHANIGHSFFFKTNYLYRYWTDASTIVQYLRFAKDFILKCEEKYGYEEVERFLDACHAIENYGVDFYKRPKTDFKKEEERLKNRVQWEESEYDILIDREFEFDDDDSETQENILYFLEKNTPNLPKWKKELIRIVRKIAQYFYPQGQTKTFNEGTASIIHYKMINKMYDEGYLPGGFMLEFLKHHASVLYQPEFSSLNPYTLGFNILADMERITLNPTDEDRDWFPNLIGKNWLDEFKYAVANFRDDSFIEQYLSPKVIRDMKLFAIEDHEKKDEYVISAIHDNDGYKNIRNILASSKNRATYIPAISVSHTTKTNTLFLKYENDKMQDVEDLDETLDCITYIWGNKVDII